MDDPRSLRIVTVGLILAALAVGYFLLTGGFSVSKPKKPQTQVAGITSSPTPEAFPVATITPGTPNPSPSVQPIATSSAANSRIASRSQGNIQTLPATGFPVGLALVFSVGTIISGWSLRKYPN